MTKKSHGKTRRHLQSYVFITLLTALSILSSCMPPPPEYAEASAPEVQPPPPAEVFFYPNQGQSPEQQERDRYECYLWAVKQTGFEPSSPNLAPHQKVVVVPEPPPGTGTAVGAVTGAILGAAAASRHHSAEGALFGAVAGAMFGTAADAARQERAAAIQDSYDRQANRRFAEEERQAGEYRRALSACLEGRGYTVR